MEALLQAAQELRALCNRSFGPCAQETLLFTPPNAPLITSDGHAVLMAWRSARRGTDHAMETFLLDAAHGVHTQLGDGTSTFILTVHAALEACSDHGNGAFLQQQLSSAFGQLKRRWRSPVNGFAAQNTAMRVRTRIDINPATSLPTRKFHSAIVDVLQTSLRGVVHDRIAALLVELVIEWVFAGFQPPNATENSAFNACQLWQRTELMLKYAPDRILFALSASVDDSRVLPCNDFIIERTITPSQPPELLLDHDSVVRFVCITCKLSMSPQGANPVTITQPNTMDRELCATTQCLRMLRERLDVRLLVCTGGVDESVASVCTRLKIACVQFAEDQDVDQLCVLTGVTPLASVFDEVSDSQHVGVASGGVTRVRMSQTAYLRFHALQRQSSLTQPHSIVAQVILKAPTKGVYKQLYVALFKALRVLASWWKPIEASTEPEKDLQAEVFCCRGAGVGEVSAVRWLRDESQWSAAVEPAMAFVRRVISDAFIDVIVLLRSNLSSSPSSDTNSSDLLRTRRRELLDRLTRADNSPKAAKQYAQTLVLDPQHVIPTLVGLIRVPMLVEADPLQYGVVHPWSRLDVLVLLVLETLERAFRIDCVVRAKRLPKHGDDTENECTDT